jgi:hypothetical protein
VNGSVGFAVRVSCAGNRKHHNPKTDIVPVAREVPLRFPR